MENQLDALHPSVTHQSTGIAAGRVEKRLKAQGAAVPLYYHYLSAFASNFEQWDNVQTLNFPRGHGILKAYMGLRPQDPDTQAHEALLQRAYGKEKAEDVKRQYVLLGSGALKGVKPDSGTSYWKEGVKNIAGDRCASWMDGRFLQGTFNGRLLPNDKRPDVSCAGAGGASALRTLADSTPVLVGMGDGSAHVINPKISETTWKNAIDPADGNPLGSDW